MSLDPYDQALIPMRMQARLVELQAQHDQADQRGPQVEEALRARHQRHLEALHRTIQQLEGVLEKLRDGSYGSCDSCGKEISAAELSREPATTLCGPCRGLPETSLDPTGT